MEASTFTTPAFMTSYLADQPTTPAFTPASEPTTIKMEDLQKPDLPMTPPADYVRHADTSSTPVDASSPAPSSANADGKPAKKRKSWGQVLPEPKTNLPPRKRAKTDDEKEQRRIERVKRNRLAAHNSRERKRQEVEALQDDKKALEDRVQQLEAALKIYQQHLPDLKIDSFDFQPRASIAPSTPAPIELSSETINPRTASFQSMTPQTSPSLGSIDSPPFTDSQPATPEAFPEATVADRDLTQHSAEMLCDPQCQSCISNRQSSTANMVAFQAAIISLIMFNLQIHMTHLLSTTCSIFHRSMITRALSSLTKTASSRTASSRRSSLTASTAWTFPTALEEILTCSPPLAQHLLLATRPASQTRSKSKITGRSSVAVRGSRLDRDARRTFRALRRYYSLSTTKTCNQDYLNKSSEAAAVRAELISA